MSAKTKAIRVSEGDTLTWQFVAKEAHLQGVNISEYVLAALFDQVHEDMALRAAGKGKQRYPIAKKPASTEAAETVRGLLSLDSVCGDSLFLNDNGIVTRRIE